MTFLIIIIAVYLVIKLIYTYNKYKIIKNFLNGKTIKFNGREIGGIHIYQENADINIEITDTDGNIIITTENNG